MLSIGTLLPGLSAHMPGGQCLNDFSAGGAQREEPFVGGVWALFAARDGLFSSDSVLYMSLDNPWD